MSRYMLRCILHLRWALAVSNPWFQCRVSCLMRVFPRKSGKRVRFRKIWSGCRLGSKRCRIWFKICNGRSRVLSMRESILIDIRIHLDITCIVYNTLIIDMRRRVCVFMLIRSRSIWGVRVCMVLFPWSSTNKLSTIIGFYVVTRGRESTSPSCGDIVLMYVCMTPVPASWRRSMNSSYHVVKPPERQQHAFRPCICEWP